MSDEMLEAAKEILKAKTVPPIGDCFDTNPVVPRNAWLSAIALACTYKADYPEPNPAHEEMAAKYRAELLKGDGKPIGTAESLKTCVRFLEAHARELYPANEIGQVHYARAVMESVAAEIEAYLAATVVDVK